MRKLRTLATAGLAVLMLAGTVTVSTPADAAHWGWGRAGWGPGWGWRGGWGRWGWGGGWGGGGWPVAAGVLGGLALGAAATAPYAYGGYPYAYGGYPYAYGGYPGCGY